MSKPTDRWLPLHAGDYLRDTKRLNAEQHGCYLLLLMESWIHGPLPNDLKNLAQICGMTRTRFERAVAPMVLPYFTEDEEGRLIQKRLEIERKKAAKYMAQKSMAAHAKHSRFLASKSNEINGEDGAFASDPHMREEDSASDSAQTPIPVQTTDSVESDSNQPNQPPTDSVPASQERKKTIWLSLKSPRYAWVDLAMSVDKSAPKKKETLEERADKNNPFPQEEVYVGQNGYRRGFYASARKVAQAARQTEEWEGDWAVLAQWMLQGYDPTQDIVPLIRDIASQKSYPKTPLRSLNYFSKALRQTKPFVTRDRQKETDFNERLASLMNGRVKAALG